MNNTTFPSIKVLFEQSWTAFTKSLLKLILLGFISFFTSLLLLGVMVIILLIIFLPQLGSLQNISQNYSSLLSLLNLTNALIFSAVLVIGFLLAFIIQQALHIAQISTIANYQAPKPLGETIKSSFPYVFPLLFCSIISGLLVTGGFFFFLIPGLIFAAFFSFFSYEVILDNKKGTAALRSSLQIIVQNFGEIVVRLIVWILIVAVIGLIPQIIIKIEPQTRTIRNLLMIIINPLISIFGLAYALVLYKQAKAITDTTKQAKMTWIVIISILGWILFLLMGLFIFKFIQGGGLNKFAETINKIEQEKSDQIQASPNLNSLPISNPIMEQ